MEPTPIQLTIVPGSNRYDEDDERWYGQVAGLRTELASQVGLAPPSPGPPGTKGLLDETIVALGTSGAITATVEIVRMFLARDRTRTVDLVWTDAQGQERRFHATADNASDDTLTPVVESIAKQVASS
ncbi:effector-associated constant component EACC1 [Luteipulveratus flavus]|uniref:Uncharacterized protein n=1 Tax=Luteipulveratus flavus TaxID=3031728 RepID=A0ABT6C8H9_9MICO|nr:hypothetical protein [Luteipulveratus sp. YIM 133296]MDF8264597.1 hypothetical protein [Luteipulveratus sp. YIM 133296]